jgi:hypothetical protein
MKSRCKINLIKIKHAILAKKYLVLSRMMASVWQPPQAQKVTA